MYRLVNELLQPYTLASVLLAVGLVWAWRQRALRSRPLVLLTSAYVLLYLASSRPVSHVVLGSLEWQYPPLVSRPSNADSIVVLAGGLTPALVSRNSTGQEQVVLAAELGPDTIYRCQQAAQIYHWGDPCKVVVCGSMATDWPGTPPLSALMRGYLVQLGVRPSDVLVEAESLNTHENALHCRELLERTALHRPILVTSSLHMPRSVGCFEAQGLEVIAAPCNQISRQFPLSAAILLPSAGAANEINQALHEWIGLVWYKLRGWL